MKELFYVPFRLLPDVSCCKIVITILIYLILKTNQPKNFRMKKLFAILTIAAAMAFISCSQYEEPVQPVNNLEEGLPIVWIQLTPSITITGGVFQARGRWQARVKVSTPTMQSCTFNNIRAEFYHEASQQTYTSQTQSVSLNPGGSYECYLDFDKIPGGLSVGQECTIVAKAFSPSTSKTYTSAQYVVKLK